MDRFWLLTRKTYGNWLPGDPRGFVSIVADGDGKGARHNIPGTPYSAGQPALRAYMEKRLVGGPVSLCAEHAAPLLAQFQETARYRTWQLLAAAVLTDHVHLVVGVLGDPEPEELLG